MSPHIGPPYFFIVCYSAICPRVLFAFFQAISSANVRISEFVPRADLIFSASGLPGADLEEYALLFCENGLCLDICAVLQFRSDLSRPRLSIVQSLVSYNLILSGNVVSDNSMHLPESQPSFGTFVFAKGIRKGVVATADEHNRRVPSLVRVPMITSAALFSSRFITDPVISVLSSLCNLQPWHLCDPIVMFVIWCMLFSANKNANHSGFTFNRSDVVSLTDALIDIRRIVRMLSDHPVL